MEKRFFTVKEARQLLPFLKETVGRAIILSSQLRKQQDVVQSLADSAANNTGSPEGTAYLETLIQLQNCLHQIQDTGCIIKSVEEGLIDFPHLKEEREVYLCWRHGEEDIQYWHEIDAGFAGRTPLPE